MSLVFRFAQYVHRKIEHKEAKIASQTFSKKMCIRSIVLGKHLILSCFETKVKLKLMVTHNKIKELTLDID